MYININQVHFDFDLLRTEYEVNITPLVKFSERSLTGKLHKENHINYLTERTIIEIEIDISLHHLTEAEYTTLASINADEGDVGVLYNDNNEPVFSFSMDVYFDKHRNINDLDAARIKLYVVEANTINVTSSNWLGLKDFSGSVLDNSSSNWLGDTKE